MLKIETSIRQNFSARWLAMSTPFILTILIDYFILNRRHFDFISDEAPHFFFGHALAWITEGPTARAVHMSHLPSVPLHEIAAFLLLPLRGADDPVAALSVAGLFLALTAAMAASGWAAYLTRSLDLSLWLLIGTAALVAVQPALPLFPWSSYYFAGVFLLPIGFGIALALRGDADGKAALFALGFVATLHYRTLHVLLALLIAAAATLRQPGHDTIWQLARDDRPGRLMRLLMMLGPAALISSVPTLFTINHGDVLLPLFEAIGAIAGFALSWRLIDRPGIWPLRPLLWVGAGWLVGINLLWREWLEPLTRLAATPANSSLDFATAWPWLLFILPASAVGALVFSPAWRRSIAPTIFVCVMALLVFKSGSINGAIKQERAVFAAVVILPVTFLLLAQTWQRLASVFGLASVLMAAAVYGQYAAIVSPTVAEAHELDRTLTAIGQEFLANHPEGVVVCLPVTYVPRKCSQAFGYGWYRWLTKVPQPSAESEKWRPAPMLGCDSVRSCSTLPEAEMRPLLIIGTTIPDAVRKAGSTLFNFDTSVIPKSNGHHIEVVEILR